MSANNRVNDDVASVLKRKGTEHEVGSSSGSKRVVPLQLFPDYPQPPQQQSPVLMSSTPALHFTPGHNIPTSSHSFTSLLNSGRYPTNIDDSVFFTNPNGHQQDPVDNLLNAQHEKVKEIYDQSYLKRYNDMVRETEEECARKIRERDAYIQTLMSTIDDLRYKVEYSNASNEMLNQVITRKDNELTYIMNMNVELQLNETQLKSELQDYKVRAEVGDQVIINLLARQENEDEDDDEEHEEEEEGEGEEDTASSFNAGELEVEEDEAVKDLLMACKVCRRRVSTVVMWPCKHLCMCKMCDLVTNVCPVCKCLTVSSTEVIIP